MTGAAAPTAERLPTTQAKRSHRPKAPNALVQLVPRLHPYRGTLAVASVCLLGSAAEGLFAKLYQTQFAVAGEESGSRKQTL